MSDTRYARLGELSIAWQVIGEGPVDVLVIPGLVSHVEAFHELPGYTRLLARLGRFARVITFDKRGNGLSDRVADIPSLPERIEDVHAVLDAVGSRRAAIFGISEGGALAIRFAATEPARTSALALFGAFPRMLAAPGYEPGFSPDAYDRFTSGMIEAWGTGSALLALFGPSLAKAETSVRDAAARCERLSATPTTLRGLWRMNASIDVRDALAKVACPTLIMHRTGDRVVPVAAARWMAGHLPSARYLELPGNDHFPFAGEQDPIVEAIAQLVDATPESREASTRAERRSDPTERAQTLTPDALDRLVTGALADEPFELGRFTVTRTLGSGGMGSVYLAEDRDLGRSVALKVLHRGDADAYRRFRREAMAVASLSHPNVVQIYELGLDASVPYLVMEYVRGGTADFDEPLPWQRACRLVAGAARGLGAAHAVGIVHRDVKPANVLVADGDVAKIADFGVAKLAGARDAMTREGSIVGTIGYLAPEQARGATDAIDARADVYALGATLYRLLTGTRAFGGTVAETLAATLSRSLPDPRACIADIPAPVAELVQRMGALDPSLRPIDGNAVADALIPLT